MIPHASSDVCHTICCDLDGVVWRGDDPIQGAADALARLRSAGARVVFLTNNAADTIGDVVAKLARHGIATTEADVMSSAQAAAALLGRAGLADTRVLACAGPGVVQALRAEGFTPVDHGPAGAVVVGWHRDFDFDSITRASSTPKSIRQAISSAPMAAS